MAHPRKFSNVWILLATKAETRSYIPLAMKMKLCCSLSLVHKKTELGDLID
jgi:hypothetical protein